LEPNSTDLQGRWQMPRPHHRAIPRIDTLDHKIPWSFNCLDLLLGIEILILPARSEAFGCALANQRGLNAMRVKVLAFSDL